jgi:hypothetical protein
MSTPEFKAALARYHHLRKTLGHDHDITQQAFTVLFSLAPDEYVEEAHKIAVDMGLISFFPDMLHIHYFVLRIIVVAHGLCFGSLKIEWPSKIVSVEIG